MSARAIAAATRVSHPTILHDLSGGKNLPPDASVKLVSLSELGGAKPRNHGVKARPEGLEPPTYRVETGCSIR